MEFSTELLGSLYAAAKAGHYAYATALALVVCVSLVRRYGVGRIAWFATDTGGAALALLGSLGAALAASLADGKLTPSVLWAALGVAVTASGGYSLFKKLVVTPFLKPWSAKAPAWAQPIFALALYLFESKAEADARAKEAGDKAVAAKPAAGAGGQDHDVP